MKNTFTSKKIAALKPQEKRFSIAIEKGLTLRVHPSGTKSWVLRVPQNNRIIDLTLGHFPEIGLQQAKAEARKRQKSFDIDPIKSYTLGEVEFIRSLLCRKYWAFRRESHRRGRFAFLSGQNPPVLSTAPKPVAQGVSERCLMPKHKRYRKDDSRR